jgi:HD superfamily phosphodiesterase
MDRDSLRQLAIKKAKAYLVTINDVVHDISHMKTVWKYCQKIAKNYPDTDLDALEVAAWWHDVGRVYDNEEHSKYSTKMAREDLIKIGYSKKYSDYIASIIKDHPSSRVPRSLEGTILRDSDKLDFLSVNRWELVVENERYQSTQDAINKIPKLKQNVLKLPESKAIYDRLFLQLQNFARKTRKKSFRKYRDQIIELKRPM